jgi:hypothetical protein
VEVNLGVAGLPGTRAWVREMHGAVVSKTVVAPLGFGHRRVAGDGVRRRHEQVHDAGELQRERGGARGANRRGGSPWLQRRGRRCRRRERAVRVRVVR